MFLYISKALLVCSLCSIAWSDSFIEQQLRRNGIINYHLTSISIKGVKRLKRNVEADRQEEYLTKVKFNLTVFGDHLTISVAKSPNSVFTEDAKVRIEKPGFTEEHFAVDYANYFVGVIQGQPSSLVHGGFTNDLVGFDGVIKKSPDFIVFVEPLFRFVNTSSPDALVVYKDSIQSNITGTPYDGVPGDEGEFSDADSPDPIRIKRYWTGADSSITTNSSDSTSPSDSTVEKNTSTTYCSLHMIIDDYFVFYMAARSNKYALTLISEYVKEAAATFEKTDFDNNRQPDNITLLIKAVTFWDKLIMFDYNDPNKDAMEFLTSFSKSYSFPDVCMAILWTYQNFGPALGMAWLGRPSVTSRTGIGGSRNHGFVTTVLYNQMLTKKAAIATTLHEVAHGFGAPHDPTERGTQCAPQDDEGGVFIMYPSVTELNQANNFILSPCAVESINNVLQERASFSLSNYVQAVCGNGRVEGDEQCDCGTPSSCHKIDSCCVPVNAEDEQGCTLWQSERVVCSETMPCCKQCQIVSNDTRLECFAEQDCKIAQFCDGLTADCSSPVFKPDGTACQDGLKMCYHGECQMSICEKYNQTQCYCSEKDDECKLCCQPKLVNNNLLHPCSPASSLPGRDNSPMWLAEGSVCANGMGFCSNQFCQKPGLLNAERLTSQVLNSRDWLILNLILGIAVGGILMGCVAATGFAHCKPLAANTAIAYQSGRTARVYFEGERLLTMLDTEANLLMAASTSPTDRMSTDLVLIEEKLGRFFPQTNRQELMRSAVMHCTEEARVQMLIVQGQPFHKFISSNDQQLSSRGSCKDSVTEQELTLPLMSDLEEVLNLQQIHIDTDIPPTRRNSYLNRIEQESLGSTTRSIHNITSMRDAAKAFQENIMRHESSEPDTGTPKCAESRQDTCSIGKKGSAHESEKQSITSLSGTSTISQHMDIKESQTSSEGLPKDPKIITSPRLILRRNTF